MADERREKWIDAVAAIPITDFHSEGIADALMAVSDEEIKRLVPTLRNALERLGSENSRLRAERDEMIEQRDRIAADTLKALSECNCTSRHPEEYDGPQADCPQHGDPKILGFCPIEHYEQLRASEREQEQTIRGILRRLGRAERAVYRVRRIHSRGLRTNACNDCGQPWPCEVIRTIDEQTDKEES